MRRSGGQRHDRRRAPRAGAEVVEAVAARVPLEQIALHFHDTRGTALANVLRRARGGDRDLRQLGRRPGRLSLRAGRGGNLATEDLIYMLDGLGIETGVNLDGVVDASKLIAAHIGHPLPSRYYQAVRATASS